MTQPAGIDRGILHQFPLPLRSLGVAIRATPEDVAEYAKEALETEATWGNGEGSKEQLTEFAITSVGNLLVTSGRTTPVSLQYKQGERLTIEMCYAGYSRFREGATDLRTVTGEIFMFPNSGGILCGGHHSGISFSIERKKLEVIAEAILGSRTCLCLDTPRVINGMDRHERRGSKNSLLFSLFGHIDEVLREGRYLHPHLALDDQIFRTLILDCAKEECPDMLRKRRAGKRFWSASIDELIDFIRANLHRSLSMTDLELESAYSARHLQMLFREKFDCTPMQFVRRQRLAFAMERLQIATWDDSVTSIARDCGYRHTSNFTADFQKEFGVAPSVVLRASRGGGRGKV